MKPHNQSERNKALGSFLLFFIITVCLIVTAVFFSFQVPFKQNDQLHEQMKLVENERTFAASFTDKMTETMNLLDSVMLNEVQVKSELIDGKITENLQKMDAMISDSLPQKNLYKNIVLSFAQLQNAKKQLREASGKDASFGDLQKENTDLRLRLQQANLDLQQCQLAIRNFQQQK